MVFCKELIFLLGKELENRAYQWSMGGRRGNPGIWWPGAPILWNTISEKFLRLTLTFFQRSFALISTGFLDALQSWDHINSIHYLISLLSFSFFWPHSRLMEVSRPESEPMPQKRQQRVGYLALWATRELLFFLFYTTQTVKILAISSPRISL